MAKIAEAYNREMNRGSASSWNLRNRHLADTLDALAAHLDRRHSARRPAKVVVWAHHQEE